MSYKSAYYTSGTAARKLNRAYEEAKEYEYVSISKRKSANVHVSPIYVIMVVAAIVFMAVVAMGYVSLQSEVTSLRKEKGQLLSQYEELKTANDLYYEHMIGAIDLKEIERIAVEELGMKMAGKGQVITYSDELDDYVKQYSDVPN